METCNDDCLKESIDLNLQEIQKARSLKDILEDGILNSKKIEEILIIEKFDKSDLVFYDDFVYRKIFKKGFIFNTKILYDDKNFSYNSEIQKIFEVYMKILNIEFILNLILLKNNVLEKMRIIRAQGIANKLLNDSNTSLLSEFFYKSTPFSDLKIFNVAQNYLLGNFDDSTLNIFSYIICMDRDKLYILVNMKFFTLSIIYLKIDHF